jgi:hypothetical protein
MYFNDTCQIVVGYYQQFLLAIRLKVRGFKPGRGDGFLRAIQLYSTPFFGGEVKPEAPRRKILWHVKNYLQV